MSDSVDVRRSPSECVSPLGPPGRCCPHVSVPILEGGIVPDGVWRRDRGVEGVVAVASLVLSLSQFLTSRLPSAFDSGVYFGAASEFVNGHLPYRDFAFVQPPGGLLLLTPWALVGRWTNLPFAFALARGCSAVVVAAVAVLVSRLTLPYGRRASLVAGAATALAPTAVYEMTSVKLESYCLLLSLLAAWWVVSADPRSLRALRRRIGAAGLVIGFAGAVKLWAFLPFVALVACVWSYGPRLLARFLLWTTVGFSVAVGPFLLVAPSAFLEDVVVAQLRRSHNVLGAVGTMERLSQMTGLRQTPFALNDAGLLVLYGVVGATVLGALVVRGPRGLVDRFFLGASALTLIALLGAREFYAYYAYFLTPLAVGLIVTSVVRIWRWSPTWRAASIRVRPRSFTAWGTSLFVVTASACALSFYSVHRLSEVVAGRAPPTSIGRYIAPGSCVIFDDAIQGIVSNRLISSSPSCPVVVDAGGLAMALGGQDPSRSLALARTWRHDLLGARYVVLAGLTPLGIPWTRSLYQWFVARFRVVVNEITYVIYRRA